MDAHFSEYLAAVAGMAELYGTAGDEAQHEDVHVPVEPPLVTAT